MGGGGSVMIMGGASSTTTSYAGFPDYIGVESCVDMRSDADEAAKEEDEENDSRAWWRRRKEEGRRRTKGDRGRKEYPPLIPLLAQTENLHAHMPWVLTRHYTPDGRLVLTGEKVRHHEYFRAHRHDGRLTLQLVTMDDEVLSYCNPGHWHKDEYDGIEDVFEAQATSPSAEDGKNVNGDSQEEEEEEEEVVVVEEGEGEGLMKGIGSGGVSKCLSYNSVVGSPSSSPSAAGSCMLGMMPLPALRQVHS